MEVAINNKTVDIASEAHFLHSCLQDNTFSLNNEENLFTTKKETIFSFIDEYDLPDDSSTIEGLYQPLVNYLRDCDKNKALFIKDTSLIYNDELISKHFNELMNLYKELDAKTGAKMKSEECSHKPFKVGDLVETCSFLPGHIVSIDGDDFEIKTPDGNISCHSIEHCGCRLVTEEYANKCWRIGEAKLRELWNTSDFYSWHDFIDGYEEK